MNQLPKVFKTDLFIESQSEREIFHPLIHSLNGTDSVGGSGCS